MSASGVFSVSLVMFYELVPKPKYPLYGSLVSAITGVSVLIGPIVGGAINTKTTWRWVFLLNIPGAFIILLLMAPLLPNKFPYHGHVDAFPAPKESVIALIRKVDFLGAFFLLSASFLITAVLLEVSTRFAWSSAFTICLLVIGILLYLAFFAWERLISSRKGKQEPMFPWYLARNRMWMGVALYATMVLDMLDQLLIFAQNIFPCWHTINSRHYYDSAKIPNCVWRFASRRRSNLGGIYSLRTNRHHHR